MKAKAGYDFIRDKIPEGWEVARLGNEKYFLTLPSGVDRFEGIKDYLSTKSIERDDVAEVEQEITYDERPSRANMQPRLGSVWFAKMQNTRKAYCFSPSNAEEIKRFILSTGFCGILCKNGVDPVYLKHVLLSDHFNMAKDRLASGSTQKAVTNESIQLISLPLPPLSEQQKIANILSVVDLAVKRTDALINKTETLKRGLMQKLLSRGIGHSDFKQTELGEIPETWKIEQFSKHCESSAYGPRFSANLYSPEGNVGTIRTTDFTVEGAINFNTVPFAILPEDMIKEHILKAGDLLISRSGTVGLSTIFPERSGEYIPGAYLIRFRMKETLFPQWLKYYFYSDIGVNSLRRISEGGVQKNLKGSAILKLKLPILPIKEQMKISSIISIADRKIFGEKSSRQKLDLLKRGLMQVLLTGKVRVKVA